MSTEKTEYLKGIALASAVALQGKRKAQRQALIDGLHRKVARAGIKRDDLVAAIEAAEKTASRSRKKAA